jgi:hypothetical protein
VLAPHVAEELDALADRQRTETVRCLIGVVQGRTAVVDLAWRPPIDRSTRDYVEYQSCPSATLAVWHNHIPARGAAPEYACYLSAVDIQEAVGPRAPPIQIVQVTRDVACWWSRTEVLGAPDAPLLFPRPAHLWGQPVQLTEAACRGALRHLPACRILQACPQDLGRPAEECWRWAERHAVAAAPVRVEPPGERAPF